MKTLKPCILALMACMLFTIQTNAQQWETTGNIILPGEFLGGINPEPLRIRQFGNIRAEFRNGFFAGYNGQAPINNVNRIFLPITTAVQQPFSLLQMGFPIGDPNLERPWMNVGTTLGAGADIMHVGMLQRPAGTASDMIVDAVIAWGCNDQNFVPENGPDNLRFLFLAPSNQPITPGSQAEGLETMRITPWGNVGIGDFSAMATGLSSQPRARLDVQFFSPIPINTADIAINANNVSTGAQPGSNKIGIDANARNLEPVVLNDVIGGRFNGFGGRNPIGVFGSGGRDAVNPTATVKGVEGRITTPDPGAVNIGVFGWAANPLGSGYAVYGTTGTTLGPNNWAAFFVGPTYHSTGIWVSSDEAVKSDIQDIPNSTEILGQLNPKSYQYNVEAFPQGQFAEGVHYGLIAQELQEVLPGLVRTALMPDEEGNPVGDGLEIKTVNYIELVPILISAFKEQSAVISSQAALIDAQGAELESSKSEIQALKAQVENQDIDLDALKKQLKTVLESVQNLQAKTNSCCDNGNTGSVPAPAGTTKEVKLLQNVPNPFDSHTRIDFTLPADAYVVLELSDAQGRPLRRLVDGQMNAGPQTITLDGSSLAPGMYFYTVHANGELLTKKMIKR